MQVRAQDSSVAAPRHPTGNLEPAMNPTGARLAAVRVRIAEACAKTGRDAEKVRLVAVAKTATAETLREAWDAGQRDFGHNRVQALEDHRLVLPEARWHLLGPLQGRKVRRGLAAAECFQALGDGKTVARCERALEEVDRTDYPVLLQVNLHPEDGRYGCSMDGLQGLIGEVLAHPRLQLQGLMTLALADAQDSQLRADFAALAEHFHALQSQRVLPQDAWLSMGMSQDFETAVEEGANLVRVGRAIFPPEEQ